ncbi:MAG: aldehyde dehydrogenase [Gammaproteobacteria bacterium]|nr:aldehyde dehydrogenase [Gammaproteobacteria bacterium]
MSGESAHEWTMTIAGRAAAAVTTLPVYNPATGEVFAQAPNASAAQLDEAVGAARNAFSSWSCSSRAERRAALDAIADILEGHAVEFSALLTREQGKPLAAAETEVKAGAHWCREIARQELTDELVEESTNRRVVTRFSPLGVVGGIVPWNFPISLAIWKIAPALRAGNCIVVKPSPFTPLCALKLAELSRDRLPPGVFSVVSGSDDLGKWMTAHPGLDKIAFTGNTVTGKHVMRSAAATLKRLTLELGGNDPAIVLPDVDAKSIAPQLFWAAFRNNGQFCNATKRLYVHEDVYDDILRELVDYSRTVKVGDGAESDTQLGPLQNEPQYWKVVGYFDDCIRRGYRFAVGGEIDRTRRGWFVPVTLVDNPPEHSRIVQEEPFGPILPLLRWRDEQDVIDRANDSPFGLGASVWGHDLSVAQRIGAQLDAGTVWINEIHQYSPHQAFGGHKQSGLGCENSLHGLLEYTNTTTITLNTAVDFGRRRADRLE